MCVCVFVLSVSVVLTVQAVLLNLFQLVVETLFVGNQPPEPLLGVLNNKVETKNLNMSQNISSF